MLCSSNLAVSCGGFGVRSGGEGETCCVFFFFFFLGGGGELDLVLIWLVRFCLVGGGGGCLLALVSLARFWEFGLKPFEAKLWLFEELNNFLHRNFDI